MVLNGRDFGASPPTASAKADLLTVYASLSSRTSAPIPSALDGAVYAPGVFSCSGPGFTLGDSSIVILDGAGVPNAVFIFITPGYLHVSPNAIVVLRKGARAAYGMSSV